MEAVNVLLVACNHSLNFYLYCLTGSSFRNDLRRRLKPLCPGAQALLSRSSAAAEVVSTRDVILAEVTTISGMLAAG